MDLNELRQKRAKLITDARALLNKSKDGDLSVEDKANYDKMFAEAGKLADTIQREERLQEAERDLQRSTREGVRSAVDEADDKGKSSLPAFRSRGMQYINAEDAAWQTDGDWQRLLGTTKPEYRTAFNRTVIRGEQRALQADLGASGGFLVLPLQLADSLIKAVDDQVFIRQWATVIAVPNAETLGVPTLEADPADADWTSELGTGGEDSTMSFGRRDLHPHPVAKRIKISRTLLRRAPGAETLTMQRLAYKFAIAQEKAFLTGSGASQPLGVFVASTQGISTGRDMATDNTSTAFTANGLYNTQYTLKAAYWPNAKWVFHRDAVKMLAKLVNGEGQYLWEPSLQAGQPDMLLGHPVNVSEYAPNTFTANLYVGILGDFRQYWIADSLSMEMQRLVELYAATNQEALIGRMESDGMPVLEEAFVRVKLGS